MGTAPAMNLGPSIRTACSTATMTARESGHSGGLTAGAGANLGRAESAFGAPAIRITRLN